MRVEFGWIVRKLEINNPFAANLRQRVLALCSAPHDVLGLLVELYHDETEDENKGSISFYALFKSCAYEELRNKISAYEEAEKAVKGFRDSGHEFNEALAHWFLGWLYKRYGEDHLAIPELNATVRLLQRLGKIHEGNSDYKKKTVCEKCIPKLKRIIADIEAKKVTGPQLPQVPMGFDKWKMVILKIDKSVFDLYHHVPDGCDYYFFETERGRVINVDFAQHRFQSTGDNSMNRALPVPVEPGDLLLLDYKATPRQNDIVAAHHGVTPKGGQKVHYLFRYTSRGLVTESSAANQTIPLNRADSIIVVAAIGKK